MGRLLQFEDGVLRRKLQELLISVDRLDFKFLRFFTICVGCGKPIRPRRGPRGSESLLCPDCAEKEPPDALK